MTNKLLYLLLTLSFCVYGQRYDSIPPQGNLIITPEFLTGLTAESNSNFPDHKLQAQLMVNFGWTQERNTQEWAQRLKTIRTGIGLGFTTFGNKDSLGGAISLLPFVEFNAFKKKNLKVQVATGMSYFTKQYDSLYNPNNQAISTDLNWSFRVFMHYNIIKSEEIDWRVGLGYFHHSNGHARLPNNGFNSLLLSLSADLKNISKSNLPEATVEIPEFPRTIYSYYSIRAGYGNNVLSLAFNDKKDIYTITGEYGKVFNNTFKVGVGFYYRFYEHYYDYIVDDESLVQDGREFESYKDNPSWNASNIGILFNGEFLLNHFGIDTQLGINLSKPGYKIDWRINQGWDNTPRDIPEYWVLGEYDTKYTLKSIISARMGIKYYLIGTSKAPASNFYLGLFINSNLGQADFNELAIGYVKNFNFKNRKEN